jgi:uncharacterized protein
MPNDVWLNLPVNDLAVASRFFEAIGFAPHPGPGNTATSASFAIGEKRVILMLFAREVFAGFVQHPVSDTATGSEVLFSIGVGSRREVDEIAARACAAGGRVFAEPAEFQGFMYGCGLCDPDGHRWNVLFMDPAVPPSA